jgi:protein-S-isoprenylcysteine O-methyltransferase Ste14
VLGTVLFVALVPGTVVVALPWLLTGWRLAPPFFGTWSTRLLGALLILGALPLFVAFCLRFVREGKGTPAPVAPTRELVVGGPFRHVRNPGYVAVVALVAGQGLLLGSGAVLVYAAVLAVGFHLFVLLYEEPTLRRTFGAQYDDYCRYCRAVPRWIPRFGPRAPGAPPRAGHRT